MRYADRLQLYVILVESADVVADASSAAADETVLVNTTGVDDALDLLLSNAAVKQARHVFSAKELWLPVAAALGAALELPVASTDVVDTIRNKVAFRGALYQHGQSPFDGMGAATRAEFRNAVAAVGYPAFAKPANGTGSDGVGRIEGVGGLDAAWRRLDGRTAIVEPFLEGPEISVESFSFDGDHRILAITDKTLGPDYVECGHVIPACIDFEIGEEIAKATSAVLTTIGLRDGPAHTEFKLTRNGPVVLETHNRTGGDMISYLAELATGTNPFWLSFRWQTGLLSPADIDSLTDWHDCRAAACVRFFWPRPGKVQAIRGIAEARGLPGIRLLTLDLRVGDTVRPVMKSADRVGMVIADGPDRESAIARAEAAMHAVEIHCVPEGVADDTICIQSEHAGHQS